jgi:hypothetical protein
MTFLTVTTQDTIDSLALNVVFREREVSSYQFNIDNYNQVLLALPKGDVPSDIAQYVGAKPDNHTKIDDLPLSFSDEQIDLISKYQYRVDLTLRLRTEKAEQGKARAILDALKSQIPADQLDALVADALVKVNAQIPSA